MLTHPECQNPVHSKSVKTKTKKQIVSQGETEYESGRKLIFFFFKYT